MGRPVTLFTGQWADLPLETLCKKAREFGYDGLDWLAGVTTLKWTKLCLTTPTVLVGASCWKSMI